MERLILDTGALIAVERGYLEADAVFPDAADLAMSAVTASELLVGVMHANAARKRTREEMVEGMIARVQVIAFDLAVARHHAVLAAEAARQGRPRGAHDLQIAASARATGRTLVTTDARAFAELPGVAWRSIG
ncbi:PIN domain-containing protein [Svornostia abyssi]|uniref:Ribonuclease VapC n=1 Tax=Svornostia abyssi TaxID=2898438 RepID=A0ABY5PG60_9ACTN|nr:PIN domain-containing protein [Parviterribacteraceae bacterium J379]